MSTQLAPLLRATVRRQVLRHRAGARSLRNAPQRGASPISRRRRSEIASASASSSIESMPTLSFGEESSRIPIAELIGWGLPEAAIEPFLAIVGAPDNVIERAAADVEAHVGAEARDHRRGGRGARHLRVRAAGIRERAAGEGAGSGQPGRDGEHAGRPSRTGRRPDQQAGAREDADQQACVGKGSDRERASDLAWRPAAGGEGARRAWRALARKVVETHPASACARSSQSSSGSSSPTESRRSPAGTRSPSQRDRASMRERDAAETCLVGDQPRARLDPACGVRIGDVERYERARSPDSGRSRREDESRRRSASALAALGLTGDAHLEGLQPCVGGARRHRGRRWGRSEFEILEAAPPFPDRRPPARQRGRRRGRPGPWSPSAGRSRTPARAVSRATGSPRSSRRRRGRSAPPAASKSGIVRNGLDGASIQIRSASEGGR